MAGGGAASGVERSKLVAVKSLREAFEVLGVGATERVDTRDLVLYTSAVQHELEEYKEELQRGKNYEAAAQVRDRLRALKAEFLSLQLDNKREEQARERALLDQAAARFGQADERSGAAAEAAVEAECAERRRVLLHSHAIQRDNLEELIRSMHRPPVRHSKLLLDMLQSENHLARLDQYEEARALGRRVAALRPHEVERHESRLGGRLELLRRNLAERQAFELRKLDERLHDLRLRRERSYERLEALTALRLRHHRSDMESRHAIAGRPEPFCAVRAGKVRPVVYKRKHYAETDAAFRGTQLLLAGGRGSGSVAAVSMVSLCTLHSFAGVQQDHVPST
jgi:hypothetical protein